MTNSCIELLLFYWYTQDAERMHERLNPFTADTLGASGSHEERKDKDPAPQINLESLFDNEVAAQVGTEPAKYKEHDQNHGDTPEAENEGPTTRSTRDPEHEGVREKFKVRTFELRSLSFNGSKSILRWTTLYN